MVVTVTLNHEELKKKKKNPQRITKIKPFIFHQKKMIGKNVRKIM